VIALFAIRGCARYASTLLLARIGTSIVVEQQQRLYSHILAQNLDFHRRYHSADLIARITSNIQSSRDLAHLFVTSIGRDLVTVIALAGVMLWHDPMLFVIAGAVAPFGLVGVRHLKDRIRANAQREFRSQAGMIAIVRETAQGIQTIKAFGLEARLRTRMRAALDDAKKRGDQIAAAAARVAPLGETLEGIAVGAVLMYGAWRTNIGGADPGSLIAFVMALLLMHEPAQRLIQFTTQFEQMFVGVSMMYETLETRTVEIDSPHARALDIVDGTVAFDHVTFGYLPGYRVLKGLSCTIEGRKVTALVGPSGSGKSTMMALIQRFYTPQQGQLKIDRNDIATLTLASLRGALGYVPQDPFLLCSTIRDNIALGREGASDAEIRAAAKAANAHDFIMSLPAQYETQVTELGQSLSGGERQRIAIARAFLRDAPIMLLDEATAALDSESEREIQAALERLMAGRTVIVIAHRLSTVRRAHRILVLEGGRVIDSGTHSELMDRNGLYARYAAIQFQERGSDDTIAVAQNCS